MIVHFVERASACACVCVCVCLFWYHALSKHYMFNSICVHACSGGGKGTIFQRIVPNLAAQQLSHWLEPATTTMCVFISIIELAFNFHTLGSFNTNCLQKHMANSCSSVRSCPQIQLSSIFPRMPPPQSRAVGFHLLLIAEKNISWICPPKSCTILFQFPTAATPSFPTCIVCFENELNLKLNFAVIPIFTPLNTVVPHSEICVQSTRALPLFSVTNCTQLIQFGEAFEPTVRRRCFPILPDLLAPGPPPPRTKLEQLINYVWADLNRTMCVTIMKDWKLINLPGIML